MKIKGSCKCIALISTVCIILLCVLLYSPAIASSTLTISSPNDGATYTTDSSITIKWNSVSGAAGYHVSVRYIDTDELVLERKWTTSMSMKISSYITSPGTYKVWVGAVETKGAESISEWQNSIYIYIDLSKADITYPENWATYPANESIRLSWDTVTGAKGYRYYIKQLSGSPDTSNQDEPYVKEWHGSKSTSQRYYTLSSSNVHAGYWYKFVVEAYADGVESSWSQWCYVYIDQETLDKPVITSPANNSTLSAGQSIKLEWNAVTGAEGYRYYIKQLSGAPDTSNNDEPYIEEWNGSKSTSQRYYTLSSSNIHAGYWYKFVVEAYADGAISGWSEWHYVYIDQMVLDKPVITSPSNWSEVNAGSSITVKWNSVSGADSYKSHIIRLKGEPNTSNDREPSLSIGGDGGEWRIDRGTSRSYTLDGSNVIGGYWYKIVIEAQKAGIPSSWSQWYYVYANETGYLDRPVITSPVENQDLEAGDSITLAWRAVDNATSYKYYIKQLVGTPDYSDNELASNSWIGETSANNRRFTLAGKYVQPNTWYKFVVEARADGYYSGWSQYTYIQIPEKVDWIHYVLPEAMKEVSEAAFSGNNLLRTFDASKSELRTIGSKAFANCTNLIDIKLPITVESIADDAFYNCPSLTIHCFSGSIAEDFAKKHNIAVEIHGVGQVTDRVQVSQQDWDIPNAEKAEASIRVTSSGSWTASSNKSWLKINKTSGSSDTNIILTAEENTSGENRTGKVTFICGDARATIDVSQGKNTKPDDDPSGGTTTPEAVITGSWNDAKTITITLGQSHRLSGYISVQNGYLGNVSISVHGGADRAVNHNYAGTTASINLHNEDDLVIDTSSNTNFNKAGRYDLVLYAKVDGSSNAVKIGEKTLIVESPVIAQTPVVSFTMTPTTVSNTGNGQISLTVTTTYTDMFYVEILKGNTPIDFYEKYVGTVQRRNYYNTDMGVGTMYTSTAKKWQTLTPIVIPAGTPTGTYTVRVTAVNNEGVTAEATRQLTISIKEPSIKWEAGLTTKQVQAGAFVCLKIGGTGIKSFYVYIDGSEVNLDDNKFTTSQTSRLVSILLRAPSTTGQHQIKVVMSDSFEKNDANSEQQEWTDTFTVIKNINQMKWPLSGNWSIGQHFGKRAIAGMPNASTDHMGVDIGASEGTPIYAAADGTVTFAGKSSDNDVDLNIDYTQRYGFGYYVRIDHGNGIKTVYGHMVQWPSVSTGQHVTAGTVIGYVGTTGASSGNHLHFGIEINGTYVDPMSGYLPLNVQYRMENFY